MSIFLSYSKITDHLGWSLTKAMLEDIVEEELSLEYVWKQQAKVIRYQVVCLECMKGYQRISADRTCIKCPPGCAECTETDQCSSCIDGYYLSGTGCYGCSTACKTCTGPSSSHCLSCELPYTLASDANNCVLCEGNCLTCQAANLNSCELCKKPFSKYANGG